MDFIKETQKAIDKVTTEKLPEMIEKQTEKLVLNIVESIFSYGDVRSTIKKKIEESINVNLEKFDLIDYNAIISKTINENLITQVNLQPILEMTKEVIGFVDKKEITLQEIADIFKYASMENNENNGEGQITFIIEEDDKYGWVEVFADVEPNLDKEECSVKFIFSRKYSRDGLIFSFRMKEKYFSTNRKEITPALLVQMSGIEAKIFRLYSAQVKITNYDTDIDIYWDRY